MFINHLKITDDIHSIDRGDILSHLHDNTMLSLSYIILLSISTVVCTLGLLLDSPAIVIGGMIISPLMWPLMKIAAGISLAKKNYITQAVFLLVVSIIVSLASSYIITLISPLKVLNSEIIARTQPTLLDIVVALSAGTVAALAIVQKKISSSLAGVAIATSLMPPLCVGGIGLALLHPQTATGGLLLFLANVVSIIFVAIFVFRIVGIVRHGEESLQKKGIIFVAIMLIITAIPLMIFLNSYSFEAMAYQKTEKILTMTLKELSPAVYLENVKTHLERLPEDNREVIRVEADVLIPEDVLLDFKQKERIITTLENELQKDVVLNLRVQRSIDLQTESDIALKEIRSAITDTIQKEISDIDSSLSIDGVSIVQDESGTWIVDAVLRGDPSVRFTEKQRSDIEATINDSIQAPITLDLEIISRISLKSQPDIVIDSITADVKRYLGERYPSVSVVELSATKRIDSNVYDVSILITAPSELSITEQDIENLKLILRVKYQSEFRFMIDQVEKTSYQY